MAKPVYCSECGMKLSVTLKALKGYGRIISLIDPHECAEEPIPLDLTPTENPSMYGGERQFANSLEQSQAVIGAMSTRDLRDRRPPDQLKSTAPANILEQMKHVSNTSPEGDINRDPEE